MSREDPRSLPCMSSSRGGHRRGPGSPGEACRHRVDARTTPLGNAAGRGTLAFLWVWWSPGFSSLGLPSLEPLENDSWIQEAEDQACDGGDIIGAHCCVDSLGGRDV